MLSYKVRDGNFQAASIIIPLNNDCTVQSAEEELNIQNSFRVITKDKIFYFKSANNAYSEAWIGALQRAIAKSADKIDYNTVGVVNMPVNQD